ncbi:extracellular solute-binding protein [Parasalinivibrio latis]|uniref:ABC transporter substrate-binding protein n=1 Tax=Parasalinivibrio latis TaxID=2952610 RepID=UPI0030E50680
MKTGWKIAVSALALAGLTHTASAKETVTVWSWFIQSTMEKSIAAFEKENPDIDVKYTYYNYSPEYLTALKAAAVSGGLPDVIGLQPGAFTQRYRDNLVPLNKLAASEWGQDWIKSVFPINVKQMRMGNPAGDDGFYILPQESQVLAIWYNRKQFENLGITVPTNYDQLVAAAKKLSDNGLIPMFQGAADGWQNINVFLMLANQYAPGLAEKAQYGQAKWTDPALVKALASWKKLFDDGVFQTGALGAHAYPTGAQLFAQGRVGMMALGSWWMQESKFPPPLSEYVQNMDGFDFFHLPPMPDSERTSPPVGGIDIGYGLTRNGENNPAAWKFLASLVNGVALQQALNDLNDLPAFEGHGPQGDVTDHVKEMSARFMKDLAVAENQRFADPVISDALENVLAGVAAGSMTPEDGAKKMQKTSDEALSK